MAEWYEKYRNATEVEIIAQALYACAQHDCGHCLYQGKGIRCADRLKQAAAELLEGANNKRSPTRCATIRRGGTSK